MVPSTRHLVRPWSMASASGYKEDYGCSRCQRGFYLLLSRRLWQHICSIWPA